MTKAQTEQALLEAEILLAAITDLRERIELGKLSETDRDELATDLYNGAAAMAKFAGEVVAA